MHQSRYRTWLIRRKQKMGVIAHQHVGMQSTTKTWQGPSQKLKIALPIVVVEKAWQSVVSPLHDVLRNVGNIVTRRAGHARKHGLPGGL
jgi:hypothetical protein